MVNICKPSCLSGRSNFANFSAQFESPSIGKCDSIKRRRVFSSVCLLSFFWTRLSVCKLVFWYIRLPIHCLVIVHVSKNYFKAIFIYVTSLCGKKAWYLLALDMSVHGRDSNSRQTKLTLYATTNRQPFRAIEKQSLVKFSMVPSTNSNLPYHVVSSSMACIQNNFTRPENIKVFTVY